MEVLVVEELKLAVLLLPWRQSHFSHHVHGDGDFEVCLGQLLEQGGVLQHPLGRQPDSVVFSCGTEEVRLAVRLKRIGVSE